MISTAQAIAQVHRNLQQLSTTPPPPSSPCTFCISMKRAAGVSAQDCPRIATKLLPGL